MKVNIAVVFTMFVYLVSLVLRGYYEAEYRGGLLTAQQFRLLQHTREHLATTTLLRRPPLLSHCRI